MQAKLLHHLIGFPVRSTDGVYGFVERVAPETMIVVIDATEQTKRTNPVAAYGGYGRKLTEITHYHLDTFLSKAPAHISDVEMEAKIAESTTLQQIALLRVVQYHGLNTFYQSLQTTLLDKGALSYKQMRAVLRDLLREHRANTPAAPSTPTATPAAGAFVIDLSSIPMQQEEQTTESTPDTRYLPNGYYTVVYNDAGEYRTFKIADADWAKDKPAGTQAVYFLSGADNTSDYTFYAFLIGREFKPKFQFRNAHDLSYALVKLLAPDAFKIAGKTYALRAKKCFVCGKKLTTPISAAAGIGPDCAANIGVDQKALAALNISEETRLEQSRVARAAAQADVDELFS